MKTARCLITTLFIVLVTVLVASAGAAAPEGQLTWGVHISLAPTWFDPAETSGIVTPFMVLYALHDALVKAMPGNGMAPSLAARAREWRSRGSASSPVMPSPRPTRR